MDTYVCITDPLYCTPKTNTPCKSTILQKIFFKKEWSSDTSSNMHELWKRCVQWKKSDTKGQKLYDSIYMKRPG